MIRLLPLGLLLFACSLSFANTTNPVSQDLDLKITATEVLVNKINVELEFTDDKLELASELPDAVLRLHDLKKVNFRGEIIYTHSPLEMSTLKSHIKTV